MAACSKPWHKPSTMKPSGWVGSPFTHLPLKHLYMINAQQLSHIASDVAIAFSLLLLLSDCWSNYWNRDSRVCKRWKRREIDWTIVWGACFDQNPWKGTKTNTCWNEESGWGATKRLCISWVYHGYRFSLCHEEWRYWDKQSHAAYSEERIWE